jgi:AAT family amino acid transporter
MNENQELHRGLKNRHIQMIAIGGAIGTGLFLGSGSTIGAAGPAVILSYAITGAFIFLIMRSLGEMTVHSPVTGSFSTYSNRYLGTFAGFFSGWNYWLVSVLVCIVETLALTAYTKMWFPNLPDVIAALFYFVLVVVVNIVTVKAYGEIEFWAAIIKVTAICAMIAFGLVIIFFGFGNGGNAVGLGNLYQEGGFLPNGIKGIMFSMVPILFSFGGIELVGITAAEAADPGKTIPKAINQLIARTLIFYIGSMFVLTALFPWDKINAAGTLEGSPFVLTFLKMGIGPAAGIMNFVVLTAALSAFNSMFYASTRMMIGLVHQGNAPKVLARITNKGIPVYCVVISSILVLIGILGLFLTPALSYFLKLMNIVTGTLITNWVLILITQINFRKKIGQSEVEKLKYKMPFYPLSNYLTIGFLLLVVVLMAVSGGQSEVFIFTAAWWVAISVIYYISKAAKGKQV